MTTESKNILKYKKLTNNAFAPSKGSLVAAGFDLRSANNYKIEAHNKQIIFTDLQIELPTGCYGRIAPRSSLAANHFIDIGAGVIDADYRGNIGIVMFNHSNVDYFVSRGDKVAQLICQKIYYPELLEVSQLSQSQRGTSGFGSTGL